MELVGGGSLINGAYPVLFYLVSKLTPGTLGSQSADLYNAAPSNSKLQLPAAANPPPPHPYTSSCPLSLNVGQILANNHHHNLPFSLHVFKKHYLFIMLLEETTDFKINYYIDYFYYCDLTFLKFHIFLINDNNLSLNTVTQIRAGSLLNFRLISSVLG